MIYSPGELYNRGAALRLDMEYDDYLVVRDRVRELQRVQRMGLRPSISLSEEAVKEWNEAHEPDAWFAPAGTDRGDIKLRFLPDPDGVPGGSSMKYHFTTKFTMMKNCSS